MPEGAAAAVVPERRSAWRSVVAPAGFVVLAALLARDLAAVALPGLNSDSLFVPDLTEDLARNGFDVAWQLSATPYLFPDVAVFAVLRLVTSDLLSTFVAAFAAHLLAVGAGTYLLLRTIGRAADGPDARAAVPPVEAALLAAGSLTATLALLVAGLPSGAADYVFFPGIHRGAVSAGLVFLAFAARRMAGRAGRLERAVAVCGVALVAFSDPGFAAWFVVPAGVVTLVRRAQHRQGTRGALRDLLLDGAAVAAAVLARRVLDGTANFDLHEQPASTDVATWTESARTYLRDLPHAAAWSSAAAAALATLWALRRRGTLARPLPPAARLLGAVVPVVLVLPCVFGVWKDPASTRYLLPLVFVAAPLLAVGAAAATGPGVRRAVLVVFAAAGLGVLFARGGTPPLRLPPCGLAEELDRLNASGEVRHGLAEYWNARLVRMRSGTGVQIEPLATRGDPNCWAENLDRFLDGERGSPLPPAVRFIVVDDLDRDAIAARFGKPGEVRRVAWTRQRRATESEIWLYPAPGPPARTEALLESLRAECDRIGLRSPDRRPPAGRAADGAPRTRRPGLPPRVHSPLGR